MNLAIAAVGAIVVAFAIAAWVLREKPVIYTVNNPAPPGTIGKLESAWSPRWGPILVILSIVALIAIISYNNFFYTAAISQYLIATGSLRE